jgi:hypothetical protein
MDSIILSLFINLFFQTYESGNHKLNGLKESSFFLGGCGACWAFATTSKYF